MNKCSIGNYLKISFKKKISPFFIDNLNCLEITNNEIFINSNDLPLRTKMNILFINKSSKIECFKFDYTIRNSPDSEYYNSISNLYNFINILLNNYFINILLNDYDNTKILETNIIYSNIPTSPVTDNTLFVMLDVLEILYYSNNFIIKKQTNLSTDLCTVYTIKDNKDNKDDIGDRLMNFVPSSFCYHELRNLIYQMLYTNRSFPKSKL